MAKYYIIIWLMLILLVFAAPSLAQQTEGDIIMHKNFWGVKFTQDGRMLKPRDVLNVMKVNEEAYQVFQKAKSNYDAAQVFGFMGGFLIGWPIGTAIGGGDPQWGLAAAGVGVVLLSIPFSSAFTKHAGNAITIYNGSGTAGSLNIRLIPGGTGAALVIRF